LRRSEIINLNIEDIDFQRQKIRVGSNTFNPKRNKHAEINIHPDCLESIKKYLEIREPKITSEKALFLNKFGTRIGKADIFWTIKRYAFKIGLKKNAYPHLFRISAITHMAQKGLNIEEIKRQSRHSDIETLLGYIQLSDEEVKDAYMRGISFNESTSTIKPKNDESDEDNTKPNMINALEIKLIEKLANGEITSEAYSHAILKLKEKSRSQIHGYQ
jgi:integrase